MSDAELMQAWRDEFARTNGKPAPGIWLLHDGKFTIDGLIHIYDREQVEGFVGTLRNRIDFDQVAA